MPLPPPPPRPPPHPPPSPFTPPPWPPPVPPPPSAPPSIAQAVLDFLASPVFASFASENALELGVAIPLVFASGLAVFFFLRREHAQPAAHAYDVAPRPPLLAAARDSSLIVSGALVLGVALPGFAGAWRDGYFGGVFDGSVHWLSSAWMVLLLVGALCSLVLLLLQPQPLSVEWLAVALVVAHAATAYEQFGADLHGAPYAYAAHFGEALNCPGTQVTFSRAVPTDPTRGAGERVGLHTLVSVRAYESPAAGGLVELLWPVTHSASTPHVNWCGFDQDTFCWTNVYALLLLVSPCVLPASRKAFALTLAAAWLATDAAFEVGVALFSCTGFARGYFDHSTCYHPGVAASALLALPLAIAAIAIAHTCADVTTSRAELVAAIALGGLPGQPLLTLVPTLAARVGVLPKYALHALTFLAPFVLGFLVPFAASPRCLGYAAARARYDLDMCCCCCCCDDELEQRAREGVRRGGRKGMV